MSQQFKAGFSISNEYQAEGKLVSREYSAVYDQPNVFVSHVDSHPIYSFH